LTRAVGRAPARPADAGPPAARPQVDVAFHGTRYALTVEAGGEPGALAVEIEERETLARWRGVFSAKCERRAPARPWAGPAPRAARRR
jgi:hypothetical protein